MTTYSDSRSKPATTIATSATDRIMRSNGRVPVKGAARLVNIVPNIDMALRAQ
jgi:hypothetical protein